MKNIITKLFGPLLPPLGELEGAFIGGAGGGYRVILEGAPIST